MMRERGLSLAELLVAMAVGLLVLLCAGSLLASANRAQAEQAEAAEMEEAGNFALETIARSVRQVAFVSWDAGLQGAATDPAAPASIAGLDDHVVGKAGEGIAQASAGGVLGSDILVLGFGGAGQGERGDGSITSCGGFGVGEGGQGWSIFYVAYSSAGEAELRCKYRGQASWGADAIVGGVDTFQVLYGLDTDNPPDGVANVYLNARAVQALDQVLAIEGGTPAARAADFNRKTWWKRVVSLKVGLVLHGRGAARRGEAPALFEVFGKAYADAQGGADPGTRIDESMLPPALQGRARRVFATTVALRNRVALP
jgi:type IV pilus assembly protein PilW